MRTRRTRHSWDWSCLPSSHSDPSSPEPSYLPSTHGRFSYPYPIVRKRKVPDVPQKTPDNRPYCRVLADCDTGKSVHVGDVGDALEKIVYGLDDISLLVDNLAALLGIGNDIVDVVSSYVQLKRSKKVVRSHLSTMFLEYLTLSS